MDKSVVSERLKRERMAKGVTMQVLADVIGIQTGGAYYRKERGLLNFSLEEAIKLARFFGKTVEELFGDAVPEE